MNANRRPLLAANWKLNHLWTDIESFCEEMRGSLPEYFRGDDDQPVDLLICPAACYLGLLGVMLDDSSLYSGSQNVSTHDNGAFTGEISAAMVADLGADYCIIGHSERRGLFGETEENISLRLQRALAAELVPILCVGEDIEERRAGRAVSYTMRQLDAQREELEKFDNGDFVIAYEPIWAIGTGENATEDDAQVMAAEIRSWVGSTLGSDKADDLVVQYGGSVKPGNISGYLSQQDVDGALIGGASLSALDMTSMVRNCLKLTETG